MFGSEAAGPDPAQEAVVEHGSAPLVVVAGAGTGKTRALTGRVAALIERGVRPERLLLLTFTRRAAAQMLSRAAAECGDPSTARRVWGGTFHAIAHRLVAEHAATLGLAEVSLLDPADVVDHLDVLRADFGLTGTQVRMPGPQPLADICSRAVNTGRRARDVIATDFPQYDHAAEQIVELLAAFMAGKRSAGLLDFDDLLLSLRALLTDPVVGPRLRSRWDHVLVDEYQDVNQIQVDIVTALRPDGQGLTVVGDDAQAVYGFRGAHSAHLHDLSVRYPAATVLRLETNFRSVQPLLDLANVLRPAGDYTQRVVLRAARDSEDAARPTLRVCYDADEQARAVADAVLVAREDGLALRGQAVLMRSGNHSRELEIELTARRVPYVKYGGLRFTDTAHVKDLVAALRLAANPRNELSWYRLLKLHRHVGKAHARAMSRLLGDPVPAGDVAGHRRQVVLDATPDKARQAVASTLDAIAAAGTDTAAPRVDRCLELVRPLVRAHYVDHALRTDDLDQLSTAAARATDLDTFLAELVLDPAAATSDYAQSPQLDDDYLTLSTVHSAKGLEWDVVHVIHAADGAFPSDMALSDPAGLAEEARLFYVAATRARDQLTIYHPRRMHTGHGDRHVYTQPSRFLDPAAMATLDTVHPMAASPVPASATPVTRVTIPVLSELFT